MILATNPAPGTPLQELARELGQQLNELGLAGDPVERSGRQAWLTGPRFFHLVSFLGCSPSLPLEPGADGAFCHISLVTRPGSPLWRLGRNSRPPRCRKCRGRAHCRLPPPATLACDQCGLEVASHQWDWQRTAGSGRLFIDIHEIHPAEAIPAPELLQQLAAITDSEWDYFYLLDEY